MIIINKDKTSFLMFDQVENVFIGDLAIKANMKSGKGMQIAKYNSIEDTKVALQILIERIQQNQSVINSPTDEEVRIKIQQTKESRARSLTGKKTKGHGGS